MKKFSKEINKDIYKESSEGNGNIIKINNKNNNIGAIYIIPTPIGNLEDITLRAIRILSEIDVLLCEDTRVTSRLLQHLDIKKKLLSYHSFNEKSRVNQIIEKILSGENIGLVSDAGTPTISDPGSILLKEAISNNIPIISLPGPTAFVTALAASGLDTDKFIFFGFPPQKKGRQTFLKSLSNYDITIILYESPHRIIKLLKELNELEYSEWKICVSREITKIYEEHTRGSVKEVLEIYLEKEFVKGEITVLIQKNN